MFISTSHIPNVRPTPDQPIAAGEGYDDLTPAPTTFDLAAKPPILPGDAMLYDSDAIPVRVFG